MKPVVERGDIVNLAPYHFFMKTTADESEDAFSGMTVPLEVEGSDAIKQAVISYSQKHYGTPKEEVEEYMEKLFGIDKPAKKIETKKLARQLREQKSRNSKKLRGI